MAIGVRVAVAVMMAICVRGRDRGSNLARGIDGRGHSTAALGNTRHTHVVGVGMRSGHSTPLAVLLADFVAVLVPKTSGSTTDGIAGSMCRGVSVRGRLLITASLGGLGGVLLAMLVHALDRGEERHDDMGGCERRGGMDGCRGLPEGQMIV